MRVRIRRSLLLLNARKITFLPSSVKECIANNKASQGLIFQHFIFSLGTLVRRTTPTKIVLSKMVLRARNHLNSRGVIPFVEGTILSCTMSLIPLGLRTRHHFGLWRIL